MLVGQMGSRGDGRRSKNTPSLESSWSVYSASNTLLYCRHPGFSCFQFIGTKSCGAFYIGRVMLSTDTVYYRNSSKITNICQNSSLKLGLNHLYVAIKRVFVSEVRFCSEIFKMNPMNNLLEEQRKINEVNLENFWSVLKNVWGCP